MTSDLPETFLASFIIGVICHISTLNLELDFEVWLLLKCYFGTLLGNLLVLVTINDYELLSALARTIFCAASFNTGVLSSMVIYRLFFHRCRWFPGPFWAKITRFYLIYLSAKREKYFLDLQEFHTKYGDVV
jgi:hypothetical protein